MKRLYFIVNPISGGGAGRREFARVEAMLRNIQERAPIEYEAVYTQHPGHAVELAKAAVAAGEGCIVAVGGDGTVNEVASALLGSGVTFGVLPFGTGNDLARVAGFPADPEEALNVLLAGHTRPMDAGMANDRFFLNLAGFGFDADVLANTARYKGRFRGMLPYLMGIVSTLAHLRRMDITYSYDGVTKACKSVLVTVGNGQYFGGGMHAIPTADLYDGLFDVVIIHDMPFLRLLTLLPRYIKGKHMKYPVVEHFRTAELTVSCAEPCALEYDGEVGSSTPVTFRLLPKAISVLVPERNGEDIPHA